ncbi:hypothetical protein V6U80_18640 [Micromonospora sp. CPCC 205543]|uniref:hypothetical protein n=1 Tax=Micromonospora sp. CPCC 205556 TaxID=3122398 RepID=UPI002FEF70A0
MELHRSPGRQVLPVVCLLAGVTLLAIGGEGGLLRTRALPRRPYAARRPGRGP